MSITLISPPLRDNPTVLICLLPPELEQLQLKSSLSRLFHLLKLVKSVSGTLIENFLLNFSLFFIFLNLFKAYYVSVRTSL